MGELGGTGELGGLEETETKNPHRWMRKRKVFLEVVGIGRRCPRARHHHRRGGLRLGRGLADAASLDLGASRVARHGPVWRARGMGGERGREPASKVGESKLTMIDS